MKILLTLLLLTLPFSQDRLVYRIEYYDPLNPTQMRTLLYNMINQFSPNCKPYSLTVTTTNAYLDFNNPCISGEELKNVSLRTIPDARVRRIYRDGNIIWPTPPLK